MPLLRFALAADANLDHTTTRRDRWQATIDDAAARGLSFIISCGDVVHNGGNDSHWLRLSEITVPRGFRIYHSISNHETVIEEKGTRSNLTVRVFSPANFEKATGFPRQYHHRPGTGAFVSVYLAGRFRGDESAYEYLDESLERFDADPSISHVFVVDAFGPGAMHFPRDAGAADGVNRPGKIDAILAVSAARTGLKRPVAWLSGDDSGDWREFSGKRHHEITPRKSEGLGGVP